MAVLDGLHLLHCPTGPVVDLLAGLTGKSLISAHVVRGVVGLVQTTHHLVVLVVPGIQLRRLFDGGDQPHEALVHRALDHDS